MANNLGTIDFDTLVQPTEPAKAQPSGIQDIDFDALVTPKPKAEETSVAEDIGKGLVTAAKETFVPWAMTKEDWKGEKSLTQIGTELAGSLAGGIGVVAAASALGAPAAVAAGAYALYSAVSREASRSAAEDQDFNFLRAGLNTMLELNPLVKGGGKLTRLGRVAGQVAGTGASEYSYTGDAAQAGVAAGITALLGIPMYRAMRATDVIPAAPTVQQTAEQLLNTDMGANMLQRTTAKFEALPPEALTVPKEIPTAFKRFAVGLDVDMPEADVNTQFRKMAAKLQPEELDARWATWQWRSKAIESAHELAQESAQTVGGKVAPAMRDLSEAGSYLGDPHFVTRKIDERTGLNTQGALDALSAADGAFRTAAGTHMSAAAEAAKATRKLGLNNNEVSLAMSGRFELLAPGRRAKVQAIAESVDGQAALQKWRDAYDGVFADINLNGYKAGYLADYIPMKQLVGADLYHAVKTRIATLQSIALKKNKSLLEVKDADLEVMQDMAANLLGKAKSDLIDSDITVLLPKALRKQVKGSQLYGPGSVLQRGEEELPEFLREYDAGKLFTRYVYSNLRPVYMTKSMQMIQANADALESLGSSVSADYLRKIVDHAAGERAGLHLRSQAAGQSLRIAASDWFGHDTKTNKAVQAAIDLVSGSQAAVYPAFLGLNTSATFRNMWQTIATTAPEMGGTYGYRTVARGIVDAVMDTKKYGINGLKNMLREAGHEATQTRFDIQLMERSLPTGFRQYATQMGDWAMGLYDLTDTINRYVTMKAGHTWAKDVAAGKPAAIKALRNVSAGRRQQIAAEKVLRDPDRLGTILSEYLVSKTQFIYGDTQRAAFLKDAGPVFAMFSKWPMMIGNDIASDATKLFKPGSGGYALRRMAEKHLLPFTALTMAAYAMGPAKDHPVYQHLFKGDPRIIAPVMSVFGIFDMGGPVLKLGKEAAKTAKQIATGEADVKTAVARTGVSLAKTYGGAPSAVLNELDRLAKTTGELQPSRRMEQSIEEFINRLTEAAGLE